MGARQLTRRWGGLLAATTSLAAIAAGGPAAAETAPDPKGIEFFENRIRPLLIERCYGCHSGANVRGGLRLDSQEAFRKGGGRGALIRKEQPNESLLMRAVRYQAGAPKMPPGARLGPGQVADLAVWVKMGAPFPAPTTQAGKGSSGPHWAFVPVKEPTIPRPKRQNWVRSPIDAFILQRLERAGLEPAPAADRRTLIRRVTFDLTGLPPTPEEVSTFLQDRSPQAFARVVDRLLASPAYGVRWGRHWLDVARYADSNGQDENTAFGNAYRYRDYVVEAFNSDKPYNRFVQEQIAGDLLPATADQAAEHSRMIATGFLSLGPKVLAEPDKQKMMMDIVDEQLDVTGRSILGLTLGCARCHDHKFDPIPTRDHYALAGIFKSTRTMESLNTVARVYERPLSSPAVQARYREFDEQRKRVQAALKQVKDANEKERLQRTLKELEDVKPESPEMAIAVEDAKQIGDVKVHLRGNHLTLGDDAPRRFLTVIAGERQAPLPAQQSGRLELAQWLTRPDHPLTARVLVNRVWLHHFGQGLVRTPDNWGRLGAPPTHPELLDWLARRFVEDGWSIKALHRRMLLTNAYQMSSRHDAKAALADPENRLWWHAERRRLEAEAIRDAMLAVSGELDESMGGTLLTTNNFDYVTNDQSRNGAQYNVRRRSIYLPVIRNAVFDLFQIFDFVDPSVANGQRSTTTVAPQALYLMNSKFTLDRAAGLARRLQPEPGRDEPEAVRRLYELAYGRPVAPQERDAALAFVSAHERQNSQPNLTPAQKRLAAWISLCQVLLASNEFVYVN